MENPPLVRGRRTWIKSILLGAGAILSLVVLIFIIFFIYYLWQIKYGGAEKLSQFEAEFSPKFTTISGDEGTLTEVDNIQKYIDATDTYLIKNNSAAVTMVAFVDLECDYTRSDYKNFKEIIQKYEPAINVVIKHLPLGSLHPNAMPAANAAMCADEQGKFREYFDIILTNQLNPENYIKYAKILNLDLNKFSSCLEAEKYKKDIEKDMLDAVEIGVRGTPTYIINRDVIEGAPNPASWDDIILKNLK